MSIKIWKNNDFKKRPKPSRTTLSFKCQFCQATACMMTVFVIHFIMRNSLKSDSLSILLLALFLYRKSWQHRSTWSISTKQCPPPSLYSCSTLAQPSSLVSTLHSWADVVVHSLILSIWPSLVQHYWIPTVFCRKRMDCAVFECVYPTPAPVFAAQMVKNACVLLHLSALCSRTLQNAHLWTVRTTLFYAWCKDINFVA